MPAAVRTVDPMRILSPQPTLVDQVYEAILAGITEGKLGADSRLIQEELAESLGVSRQPVQQALLLLRSHGLLRDAPGRGLMVVPLDPEHVRNLFEVRAVLEELACIRAAQHGCEQARSEGPAYIARGRVAAKRGSIAEMTAADMEFHFFVYRLSGNPLIAEMCRPHWSYLRRVMGEVLLRGERPRDVWDQHEAMLDAIAAGDAAKAQGTLRQHVTNAADLLTGRIERRSEQEAGARAARRAVRARA
jgi:DNA-binding GntR family transcriptional regulator